MTIRRSLLEKEGIEKLGLADVVRKKSRIRAAREAKRLRRTKCNPMALSLSPHLLLAILILVTATLPARHHVAAS